MTEAADFLRLILLARPFLETANEQHQREHLDLVALLRLRHKAGLDRARLGGGHAGRLGGATQVETENEKPGEEQIAHDRVAEKHPARRSAVLRQTDGKRLDEPGKILQVTGIEEPGDSARNDIKYDGGRDRCRQKRLNRSAVAQQPAERADQREPDVMREDERAE